MVVEEVTVDGENNLDITLAVPVEEEGEPVAICIATIPKGGRGLRWSPPEGERFKVRGRAAAVELGKAPR